MSDTPIYKGKYLELRLKDGWYEYCHDRTGEFVGIFVYILDDSGDVDKVLGRWEYSVQTGNEGLTSITGGVDDGESPIEAAIRELGEEGGFDVSASDLLPLGTMTLSKSDDSIMYLYGFNATNREDERRPYSISDGTIGEDSASCDWVHFYTESLDMQNPVNYVCFLRLVKKMVEMG